MKDIESTKDVFTSPTEYVPNVDSYISPDDRVRRFKDLFALESPYVRKQLVQDLEAYNFLLSLEAMSYKELALQDLAREREIEYDRDNPPLPSCPCCGSIKTGQKTDRNSGKENLFRCYDCKKTFAANYNSISSGSKVDLLSFVKLLYCMLRYETVAKSCEICSCTPTTYYRMRSRIYYAIQIFLRDLRLYGNIQADETYTYISYKGSKLKKSPFDEDDDRYEQEFKHRDRRDRGGPYSSSERNANSLCIFAAVDDYGHVFTCYSGVGLPRFGTLKRHVPDNKFLGSVPEEDPFPFMKKQKAEPLTPSGANSLFICDKEPALIKYASDVLSMKCYSRVFRKKGKQAKVPKKYKHLNIQKVNYIHRRLEEHLVRSGSGSSRYIKGSLLLFDFIMNTGAPNNQKAMDELIHILARPNLGQDEEFYENMFAMPNHLFEWFDQENVLNKLPYNKVYAYYLYDKYKHPVNYLDSHIPTIPEIEVNSGLSITTVRSTYRDYSEAGYRKKILGHFGYDISRNEKMENQSDSLVYEIDNVALAFYDRYAEVRVLPASERISLDDVCNEVNAKYQTNYTKKQVMRKFKIIEESGLRPPLPNLNTNERQVNSYKVHPQAFQILAEYERIMETYSIAGKNPPSVNSIIDIIAEKHPELTWRTIKEYLYLAKHYKKNEESVVYERHKRYKQTDFLEDIYDEYAAYRISHTRNKEKEVAFLQELIDKYGLTLSVSSLLKYIKKELIESGKRSPLPNFRKTISVPEKGLSEREYKVLKAYERIIQAYFNEGISVPPDRVIVEEIQKEIPVTLNTLRQYLVKARALTKAQEIE